MATTYWEMHGWPRGRWDQGDFDGERRLMCAWTDVPACLLELDAELLWPASEYPWGATNAAVRSAEVIPFGKSTAFGGSDCKYNSYEWALIVCKYSTRGPKWNALKNMFIEETLDPAFNSFEVDTTNLRWSDGKMLNVPIDDHDVLIEYQVKFHHLSGLPPWILTKPGGCNSGTVTTIGLGWPAFAPETLKYNGCAVEGRYSIGNLPRYNLTVKFVYKWSEWNKFWRPEIGGGQWETVKTKDGDRYIQHPLIPITIG